MKTMRIVAATIVILCLLVVMAGCKQEAEQPPDEPVADSIEAVPDDEPTLEISVHQESGAISDKEYVYCEDISGLPLINGEDIPASLSVYTNKYPIGQGGALFPIDQTLIDGLKENLTVFLRILYGENGTWENDFQQSDTPKIPIVYYDTGLTEINSKLGGISMRTNEYGIDVDILNDNLLENELFKSALDYLSIVNPCISSIIVHTEEGEIYDHITTVTETADDSLGKAFNNSFSYVRSSYGPDSSRVYLVICKADIGISDVSSEETVIPYQAALAYVQDLCGMESSDSIFSEIYYSTTVKMGFFVPCYKFYIDTGETDLVGNSIKYDIVRIPAVSVPG
ncbi:MAG: hypothetical protein FWG03_00150 [Clostridiales bacterium]|nr:hypothetical protein [Clostridiales bacterium]